MTGSPDDLFGLTSVTVAVNLTPDTAEIFIDMEGGSYLKIRTGRSTHDLVRVESVLDSLPELILAATRGKAGDQVGGSVLVLSAERRDES